jgi:hypothetical protein
MRYKTRWMSPEADRQASATAIWWTGLQMRNARSALEDAGTRANGLDELHRCVERQDHVGDPVDRAPYSHVKRIGIARVALQGKCLEETYDSRNQKCGKACMPPVDVTHVRLAETIESGTEEQAAQAGTDNVRDPVNTVQ